MSNDEKYKTYKRKKIFKYLVMFLSFATITLEAFALFQVISFLWGLGTFALLYIVKYFYYNPDFSLKKKKNTNEKIKEQETKTKNKKEKKTKSNKK